MIFFQNHQFWENVGRNIACNVMNGVPSWFGFFGAKLCDMPFPVVNMFSRRYVAIAHPGHLLSQGNGLFNL
jgi:hypothetical protein